ncbi:uncharacterized protein LOC134253146 [Saccostrea cucullata]|uniref:uncharacterized protein LOC134253146 n=1 Tax=Saccostrea cuccullata TaxID=36930 RepID=UPI002ED5B4E2
MFRGWISSVSSKISRALGGALDAELESEEDVNTSSEIEHIEEGELAEHTTTAPENLTPEEGGDKVTADVFPGEEGEGRAVTTEEAVDSRNIPPVVHNTSGTCVDICPEEVTNQAEDEGAGSFIVVREDLEIKRPAGMDNSAWENISVVQESSPEKAANSSNSSSVRAESSESSSVGINLTSESSPVRVESSESSPIIVESSESSPIRLGSSESSPIIVDSSESSPVKEERTESSPEKPFDSSGSIEVIHVEDSDEVSEGKKGQPKQSMSESIVIIDEEVKGQPEPHCGSDLAVTAAMMESVCRDLDGTNISKAEKTDSGAEGTVGSEELTSKQGSGENVIPEEVRNRKISEVQEISMLLSEEDTSINMEELSQRSSQGKEDDQGSEEKEENISKQKDIECKEVEELSQRSSQHKRNDQGSEEKEDNISKQQDKEGKGVEEISQRSSQGKGDGEGKRKEEQNISKQQNEEKTSEKQEKGDKPDHETKKAQKGEKTKSTEVEPEDYLEFVLQKTAQGEVVPAKHLIYKLGLLNVDQKIIESAILDQYKIAVKRKFVVWIEHCRYHAELLFSPPWIADHLPKLGSNSAKEKKRWQARNQRRAKRWEREASGMCRDVRLEKDPNIDIVRENAAGDLEKVTDKCDADHKTKDIVIEADIHGEEQIEEIKAEKAVSVEDEVKERGNVGPVDKSSANQEKKDKIEENVQNVIEESSAILVCPARIAEDDTQKIDTPSADKVFGENHDRRDVCETSKELKQTVPSAESSVISENLHEAGGETGSKSGAAVAQVDVVHRKKVSPCKKGKSVKAREIDLSACRREGMEAIEERESHSGKERRKSDLYDKRKDRVDDSVSRESKKPKTEQESMVCEMSMKQSKDEDENRLRTDKRDIVSEKKVTIPSDSDLFKEVEEYANEIIQSSIDVLSLEENKPTDINSNNGQHQSRSTERVDEMIPNLAELSMESKSAQQENVSRDEITADESSRLPVFSELNDAGASENQDFIYPSIQQVMFEDRSEHMTSSLSSFTETEIDSSPFLRKESEQEMLTTANRSPLAEFSDSVANEKVLDYIEKSCEESKPEYSHLETDPGTLLVSPDYVVSPKFEVPPNTPASGCAEISQPAKLKNLNLMQNKAKLEKEVADLLSGLTLKFRHPVGSNLEEFQPNDSDTRTKTDDDKHSSLKSKKTEVSDDDKDQSIQTADSAIISANSFDTSVEELEKIDICVKHDLSAAEEGRCSPEEYLSLLQQVLPNVTSITKLKSEQDHGNVQCNVVSSSNNAECVRESDSLVSEESGAEMCKSPTEVVNDCDLSVAENVEVPCKLPNDTEKKISIEKATEVMEEELDADQEVFTSRDDLALEDRAMNRPEDPHNYCLSQSDGARLFKSMYEVKRPEDLLDGVYHSDVTKKRYNSAKSSTSKSSESEGQFTKLKMSRKLSKSDEKLKQTSKPPWNSNTKVNHGKTGNITPSRIPKACKTKSGSLSNTKQMVEKSKSVKGKSEDLPLEAKAEVLNKHYGGDVCSTDDAYQKIDKDKHGHVGDDKSAFSKDSLKKQSAVDRSVSSEKKRNADQAQKVLSEIEKGRCEMDQVERSLESKVDSCCQSVQASGNVEEEENQKPTASASTKEKSVPKWKSKNSKKSKGRQKNRW